MSYEKRYRSRDESISFAPQLYHCCMKMLSKVVYLVASLLLILGTASSSTFRNLAKNRPATQSSHSSTSGECPSDSLGPSKAVNEMTEGLGAPYCTYSATDVEDSPWWEVDLGYSSIIKSIVIYTPENTFAHANYAILLKNSNGNIVRICNLIGVSGKLPRLECSLQPSAQSVRYVRIELCHSGLTKSNQLLLSEVRVFGDNGEVTERNLALNKPASSDAAIEGSECAFGPQLAVDGNTNGNSYDNFLDVFATAAGSGEQKWQVDIGNGKFVTTVSVFLAYMAHYDSRGLNVTLVDTSSAVLASQHINFQDVGNPEKAIFHLSFNLENVKYVRVESYDGLFLPEVQVWGYDSKPGRFS